MTVDALSDEPGLWAQGLGSWGEQDTINDVAGFDYTAYGFMAGYDWAVDDNMILGGGLGLTKTDYTSTSSEEADMTSFLLTVYGAYDFNMPLYLDVGLIYSRGNLELSRDGGTITGDTDATTYALTAEVGYDIPLSQYFMILTPVLKFMASKVSIDAYTEKGTGSMESPEVDRTFYSLGAGLKGNIELNELFSLKLRLLWDHEFSSDIDDVAMAADIIDLGIGVQYRLTEWSNLSLDYDFEFGDSFTAHTLLLFYKYMF